MLLTTSLAGFVHAAHQNNTSHHFHYQAHRHSPIINMPYQHSITFNFIFRLSLIMGWSCPHPRGRRQGISYHATLIVSAVWQVFPNYDRQTC